MIPYEYVSASGDWLLTHWRLEVRERRSFHVLIALLLSADHEQAVGSIIYKEPKVSGIYYAKFRGDRQLRPRCCRGPERADEEVTFLARAEERGGKTIPADAARIAGDRLEEVRSDPERRRRRYWYPK